MSAYRIIQNQAGYHVEEATWDDNEEVIFVIKSSHSSLKAAKKAKELLEIKDGRVVG